MKNELIIIYKDIAIYTVIFLFFFSCKQEKKSSLFHMLPDTKTGISFSNDLKISPELNILTYLYYYNGAGVATADFNNDGWEDLYFVANQDKNKLFINQKNFQFEEVSSEILMDADGWSTGVTIVDINNDGWLDIYICKVGGYKSLQGKNKLLVNQGTDDKGIPQFKEEAAAYKLDITSFSTQASFFDYDLDGDLDMYLLNHSVHPNQNYGRGSRRKQIEPQAGDKLFRNDDGQYTEVSKEAGIFQGAIGYGLGIATSDVNADGYPDIYIGNDFFENDYLYLNQKDGTFREVIAEGKKNIQHTSHFSMGVDISDINNDGMADILSLDMLSEDIETYRASGTEHGYSIYNQYLKNGYQHQYMQNALQLNRGNARFSEIAFYSGIAATEWSWAPLIGDYDNDGFKDIFVSNGIFGATNDMDFISFIANDNIQKRIFKGMKKEDLALIDELPSKKTANYFYRNNGDLTFENVSKTWASDIPSYSNGAVYVDLDNDGDLDIVTNNCNEKAFVYENQTDKKVATANYIKLQLKGSEKNRNAIGAKVTLFTEKGIQTSEVFRTRGYLSAVSPIVHFGLGNEVAIDSIMVRWPLGETTVHKNVDINTTISLQKDAAIASISKEEVAYLVNDHLDIPYKHQDYETKDFNIETLAPYANSNEGPQLSVVDIDKDGLEDVFVPGGRFQISNIYLQQKDGSFLKDDQPGFDSENRSEVTDPCFFDADQDGDLDLVLVSGGNEDIYRISSKPVLFMNDDGIFRKKETAFPEIYLNASVVIASDIDQDGDQDLFIGSSAVSGSFGQTGDNYLLENDGKGNFKNKTDILASGLRKVGQVYDAQFVDINKDSHIDLVIAGYYIPITLFIGDGKGNFEKNNNTSLADTNGWWNCIQVFDADRDGDMDIVAGNWGLNSRLRASVKEPIRLYRNDFDDNGKVDPVTSYFYQGKEIPIAATDELTKQMPILNKRYRSYTDFAKADFQECFTKPKVDKAEKKEVFTLESTYFENTGDQQFKAHTLPWDVQLSSVHDICVDDVNNDEFPDLILGGNTYEISTQLSRLDASYGVVLVNDKKGGFKSLRKPGFSIHGAVRSIRKIKVKDSAYYLFGVNSDSLQVVKKSKP